MSAYRARIVRGARGTKPRGDTPRAYRVVTGKAHLPLDDTGRGAECAAVCEADDAAFAAVGPYAVLGCQQLAEECLRHLCEVAWFVWWRG